MPQFLHSRVTTFGLSNRIKAECSAKTFRNRASLSQPSRGLHSRFRTMPSQASFFQRLQNQLSLSRQWLSSNSTTRVKNQTPKLFQINNHPQKPQNASCPPNNVKGARPRSRSRNSSTTRKTATCRRCATSVINQ